MSHENSDHPLTLARTVVILLNGRDRPRAGNANSSLPVTAFVLAPGDDPLPTGLGDPLPTELEDPRPTGLEDPRPTEEEGADTASEPECSAGPFNSAMVLGGSVVASEGALGLGVCGPPADGICSQYWFAALTVWSLHGAPGAVDDAASASGTPGPTSAAITANAHATRCVVPNRTVSG